MRKLIVLIMTSVLATGAVAQADQVTVVENPADYINVRGIFEKDGSALDSEGIVPYVSGTNPNHYRLRVDVKDAADELEQVAVCLYDSAVITDPDNTNCGRYGLTPPTTSFPTSTSAFNGALIQESVAQMIFFPGLYNGSLAADTSGESMGKAKPEAGVYHTISPERTSGDSYSRVTEVGSLGSDTAVPGGDVWALDFAFALLSAAHHTNTWKIRVLAIYNDGVAEETFEIIDTDSYPVKYFGGFKNNTERSSNAVDYGNVAHGSSATLAGITTGEYYANFDSNVSLTAGLFEATGDPSVILGFSGDTNPTDGEVSLECGETGEAKTLFDAILSTATGASAESSKTLLSLAPNSQPVGDADPTLALTANTHECTFYAGTSIDTREYTNDVTIGILEVP
jgi:hypothetical protein